MRGTRTTGQTSQGLGTERKFASIVPPFFPLEVIICLSPWSTSLWTYRTQRTCTFAASWISRTQKHPSSFVSFFFFFQNITSLKTYPEFSRRSPEGSSR